MPDPLLTRAQVVIEVTRRLRGRRRALMEQRQKRLIELRIALLECAMTRVEIKAYREDRVRSRQWAGSSYPGYAIVKGSHEI